MKKKIIIAIGAIVITYLIASNFGSWVETTINTTSNKESYAAIENNELSSELLGFKINFPSNWDVMSDEIYNNKYYDNLSTERRIAKIDTTNKFIKGFVAYDKNSKDYMLFGFMRMELDYDSNKSVYDIVKTLKTLKQYKIVEDPQKTLIDNNMFNTIYAEVDINQYSNKQRWYIFQSDRMIVQITAVSQDNIENVDTLIKAIDFK